MSDNDVEMVDVPPLTQRHFDRRVDTLEARVNGLEETV
jgi:hypothetical protein